MPRFLVVTAFLTLAAICNAAERPNILWITSEDNGPHLGCYGDEYAVTPNLDELAQRGMLYTNAISTAPVCAPARTTIISGIYPPSSGSQHMRSSANLPATFKMYPQFLRAAGYYCTNNSKEDYNLIKSGQVWDESSRKAHWKKRGDGQPFFAIFNHTISHESQIRNKIAAANKIHDPAKAYVPAYHPDTPEVRANWAQYHDRITMMDALVGKNLTELEEAGLANDTIIFYYGDHGSGMPRSKRWPYNSGLNIPFIVHFPTKWKHLAPKEYKASSSSDRLIGFIDLAPTLLSIIGKKPPEWMQGHAFAGKHETAEPEYSFGFRGRMDERYDMVRTVKGKRYIYIRNFMPHKPYGQFIQYMFVTQSTSVWHRMFHEGKLNASQSHFWRTKPAEELYDLKNDPDEVHNLAGSEKHQSVLADMRRALGRWAKQIKDVGFLSEWEIHHRAGESTPYEMGHDDHRYDFDSIYAAAQLATSLEVANLPAISKLLKHEDSGVRYWGAIGLLTQGKDGVGAARDALVAALKDKSPMVRITAAEALGRYGNTAETKMALDVLLTHAAPEQDAFLAIAAWNALDHMDGRAASALDRIRGISPTPKSALPRTGKYSVNLKRKTVADLESLE